MTSSNFICGFACQDARSTSEFFFLIQTWPCALCFEFELAVGIWYLPKRTGGDAFCFPGRVILTELADLIELDFFSELVQHCDVSAHKVFQISKIKFLIEDPAPEIMQCPLKGKIFVLFWSSKALKRKQKKKNTELHGSWKTVSSNYIVQRHFKIASDLIPQCHSASFYSAEESSKRMARESTAGVLEVPGECVITSMPAAVLCQAPARWEMLCLDPVGSNLSPIPPCPPLKSFGMESYRVLSLHWKPEKLL